MNIEYAGNSLFLYTPYSLKDLCSSIPGRRWDRHRRAWEVPYTPFATSAIIQRFREHLDVRDYATLHAIAERIDKGRAIVEHKICQKYNHKTEPWSHQRISYGLAKTLLGLGDSSEVGGGCMLALDMGAGKTKVAVDLIQNHPDLISKALVVCPSKAIDDVWERQFPEHAFHNDYLLKAATELSIPQRVLNLNQAMHRAWREGKQFIAVTNYEATWREPMSSWIRDAHFDLVVCDEIHRIKANNGRASRFFAELFKLVPFRLGLTGTPLPHSLLDAFGSYRFLDPGIFGTVFGMFRASYSIMGGFQGKQVLAFKNEDDFNAKFYSIAYRVKTDDVMDLPPSTDVIREFSLDKDEARAYNEMDRNLYTEIMNEEVTAANALVKLLRLQQITSGIAADGMISSKAELLLELLEDFDPREPIVIVARFTKDIMNIKRMVESTGRTCGMLDGEHNDLLEWKCGNFDVLAMQIQSGKEGIDLTRSRYAIIYSIGFSLGDYLQMRRRFRRPGQTRNVVYLHLIAKKTIDAKIMKVLNLREQQIENVLSTDREFMEAILKEYKEEHDG
jgi:SNF2 family DNA or RNA helicase